MLPFSFKGKSLDTLTDCGASDRLLDVPLIVFVDQCAFLVFRVGLKVISFSGITRIRLDDLSSPIVEMNLSKSSWALDPLRSLFLINIPCLPGMETLGTIIDLNVCCLFTLSFVFM